MGADLLQRCAAFDNRLDTLRTHVLIGSAWTDKDFATAQQQVRTHGFSIDARRPELAALKQFLIERRSCLLALLENPNLLEHETFTDLLWAVSHLTEELAYRPQLQGLPDSDYAHLSGDLQRAYTLLIYEWLAYVKHLRDNYPYMYSLVVRMNPFVPDASPIVC
jgi:hypothetical protein